MEASLSPITCLGPSEPAQPPPPRVLLLHGYSQNSQEFLFRYKPLLERKLSKFCTLVCPSAPFPLLGAPPDGPARTWWHHPSPDPARAGAYEGLETSRALLLALNASHGPFTGVLGFSQGASLAHLLLAEGSLPACRWAILASGFPSRCALAGAPLPIPSLHLSSASDVTVAPERSAALAACFAGPQLLQHGHGHAMVQRAEHCNTVVAFIREHMGAAPSP